MNSIVSLLSNFKEFYSEINGATLTGAIDVVVVEQPDGSYQSSPFHVRFGKLGVLRSREKVVDIELNGEPVELQMKLGDSGEAFFVEECDEDDSEVPAHMATSPIPSHSYLTNYDGEGECSGGPMFKGAAGTNDSSGSVGPVEPGEGMVMMVGTVATTSSAAGTAESIVAALADTEEPMLRPRRNSVDLSNEIADQERAKFENQRSEYRTRRHTDNVTNRPDLSLTKREYTMQKLRQEWEAAAEAEQEQIFHMEGLDNEASSADWRNSTLLPAANNASGGGDNQDNQLDEKQFKPIDAHPFVGTGSALEVVSTVNSSATAEGVMDSKSKKKRRKKSILKKKNAQRKGSIGSSSGGGSNHSDQNDVTETDSQTTSNSQVTVSSTSNGSTQDVNNGAAQSSKDEQTNVSSIPIREGSETPDPCTTVLAAPHHTELDIHFFSDTDIGTGVSPQQSRPSTPIQSDTEFEMSQRAKTETEDERLLYDSWKWGELPTKPDAQTGDLEGNTVSSKQAQHNSMLNGLMSFMKYNNKKKRQSVPDGLYLSDLDKLREPEVAQLYFPPLSMLKQQQQQQNRAGGSGDDEDRESGNGTSIPHSPTSMEEGSGGSKGIDSDFDEHNTRSTQCHGAEGDSFTATGRQSTETIALSMCGGLDSATGGPSDEQFERHRLQYTNVLADPSIFAAPELVVRVDGKYYSFAEACPRVMTLLAFQKTLPDEVLGSKKIESSSILSDPEHNNAEKVQTVIEVQQPTQQNVAGGRWWYWRRSNESKPSTANDSQKQSSVPTTPSTVEIDLKSSMAVGTQTSRSNSLDDSHEDDQSTMMPSMINKTTKQSAISPGLKAKTEEGYNGSLSSDDSELVMDKSQPMAITPGTGNLEESNGDSKVLYFGGEKYRKTLRLSTDRIKALNLLDGMNEIVFSVTTAYQGTTRCKCYLFKWKHNDKVVISDIDGTITRSDVLGHILPMVGKSWDQIGVAQLFSKIEENGYKMLYLSARAIGQAKTTRGYLQSIRQGDVKLPDGPLLLNPTSLMSAFHREVIEKKPEQFKIACLNDIRELFPEKNPFYAGYGNRINDVWAYRAVGIPTSRIFTINPKGELKHELTQTFQSTYANMAYIVDQLYPPIKHIEEEDNEYTSFNYWREPVPEIDFNNTGDTSSNHATARPLSGKVSPTATIVQQALPTIPEN
ncbi:phosphatidate phosphatase LPIN3-like isoform X1 [Anopheles albimanus]|uniref:phosphatidate phosphatase LPIN3-like isoform X1 n=1 Tax=Anopheles albimanus TaxID=7167 RepID=UPI0016412F7D|nr:phosphatidate phosphatase LPIN3-like isoform X1 [Anopheles albimanus]XP_035789272.1 phosphatidate phosphatase LPIN3-like isoform X1 [Anopheles albimanus]XP_035789273.1 phosphatidate phosphatase LPIN3-like isoform X1 [Anopheles albimanus]